MYIVLASAPVFGTVRSWCGSLRDSEGSLKVFVGEEEGLDLLEVHAGRLGGRYTIVALAPVCGGAAAEKDA